MVHLETRRDFSLGTIERPVFTLGQLYAEAVRETRRKTHLLGKFLPLSCWRVRRGMDTVHLFSNMCRSALKLAPPQILGIRCGPGEQDAALPGCGLPSRSDE